MKKKNIILSTIILMIMSINIKADMLDEIFKDAKYEGLIRIGYQSHKVNQNTNDEMALGVKLHMETTPYYGLQIGTSLFTSQGNGKKNFEGVPFFDENNNNYTILAEAYIKGMYSDTIFILGRQSLETPFADSDDIGMIPNTFEAFTLINKSITDTTLFFSHVQKWSGVDSDAPSRFTKLNDNNGMQIFGLSYKGLNNTTLSGWFYNLKNEVKITYLETNYEDETDRFTYGVIGQYALQNYDNGDSSTIYGTAVSFGIKKVGLTTTVSYNKTKGIAAENFFGGGPFLTNAEHNTLKEAGADGNTILYTFQWDAGVVGVDGLIFTANIDKHSGNRAYAKEHDLTIEYTYSKTLNISAIFSNVDDKDESFKNLRIFANYTF